MQLVGQLFLMIAATQQHTYHLLTNTHGGATTGAAAIVAANYVTSVAVENGALRCSNSFCDLYAVSIC